MRGVKTTTVVKRRKPSSRLTRKRTRRPSTPGERHPGKKERELTEVFSIDDDDSMSTDLLVESVLRSGSIRGRRL